MVARLKNRLLYGQGPGHKFNKVQCNVGKDRVCSTLERPGQWMACFQEGGPICASQGRGVPSIGPCFVGSNIGVEALDDVVGGIARTDNCVCVVDR